MDPGPPMARAARAGLRPRPGTPRAWRLWRTGEYELRHERHGPQHLLGDGPLSSDLRRGGRHRLFRHRLPLVASADWSGAHIQAVGARPTVALVLGHFDHHRALAYHRFDGRTAAHGHVRLRRAV